MARWNDDEDEGTTCPTCSGPAMDLGKLADCAWFRCRNCGATWFERDAPVSERS